MQMLVALTRGVSLRIAECELTFIDRRAIDYPRAVEQHSQYQQLLRSLGANVITLPSDDQCPDCCFLEDTALVLDEVAVITRPGSEPRRREVDGVARSIIEDAGHAEHFGHGVGHGVGMEIHEGPRLSRTAGDEPLRAGNVVTVEPGVYLAGRLGVRIEDLVVVADAGHQCLTGLSKELVVVE